MAYNPNLPAGSAVSASSAPVVIASDQAAVSVKQATGTNLHAVLDANSGVDIGKLTANQSINNAQIAGTAVSVNNGTTDAGTTRVTLSSDSTGQVKLAASSGTDIGKLTANQSVNTAQINGVTPLMGSGINGTGAQRVTIATDQAALTVAGLISVKIDQTTPGTTNAVTQTPATPTAFLLSSAATTNATSVKGSSTKVFQITASNVGAAAAFLKIFNKASAPTVGTDVPVLTIPIATSGVVNINFGELGMLLATGFALDITNLAADSDTTVIAAAQVKVMASYI